MKQILLVLAVFSALLSCAVEEVVFQADFNRKDALSKWSKNPDMTWQPDGGINNSGCLKFHSTDPNGNHLTYIPLDINQLRGRGVVIEGWMKADQVKKSSRSYLGPKLMLSVIHDGKTSYPDQTKKYGTYNWEKFSRYWHVPATATKAYLNLGLQGTTGTVWIDEVRVFLAPALKVPARLEKQLPRQKRTQYRGVMSGNDLSEEAIRELKEVWNANLIRFQIGQNNGLDHTTEAGFRKIERKMLEEICEFERTVVACGGGTPCHFDNIALMNSKGTTVYLTTSAERIAARLSLPGAKAKRPIIAGKTDGELKQFIADNLKAREPYYSQASITFDSTDIETAAATEATAAHLAGILNAHQ